MELNNLQNTTTARNVYGTSADALTSSPAASTSSSSTDTGFGGLLAQAMSTAPSKTLNPEVLAATIPSTTIATSSYVFDPLCVVGQVPESNTFLQAIRAMLGKPLEAQQTDTPPTTATETALAVTIATSNPFPTFGSLPAVATQVVESKVPSSPALATSDAPVIDKTPATPDLMSSIEAQLKYQTSDTLVGQYAANLSLSTTTNLESLLTTAEEKEAQTS
jgi:hypothetical protein